VDWHSTAASCSVSVLGRAPSLRTRRHSQSSWCDGGADKISLISPSASRFGTRTCCRVCGSTNSIMSPVSALQARGQKTSAKRAFMPCLRLPQKGRYKTHEADKTLFIDSNRARARGPDIVSRRSRFFDVPVNYRPHCGVCPPLPAGANRERPSWRKVVSALFSLR
jgi:hypothetical protein